MADLGKDSDANVDPKQQRVGSPGSETAAPTDTRALGEAPYDNRRPFDRVPQSQPRGERKGERPVEQHTILITPPATLPAFGAMSTGGSSQSIMAGFLANSARIDNLTSQWAYVPEYGAWIPPFWYGRTIRLTGTQAFSLRFETPPGQIPLVVDITQFVRLILTNDNWTEVDGESLSPDYAMPIFPVSNVAEAASLVVKNAPGKFFGMAGYITGIGAQSWIQVHDAASLPANTAIPRYSLPLASSANPQPFSLFIEGDGGDRFANGIVIAISSTGPTLTVGGATMFATGRMR